jgi:hypothetical protein
MRSEEICDACLLVIVDESDEARVALRFATRRAIKTQGQVHILALVRPALFGLWRNSGDNRGRSPRPRRNHRRIGRRQRFCPNRAICP